MNFYVQTDKRIDLDLLSKSLGITLWHIAIALAPYDTGNLRNSIYMRANTDKQKRYDYSLMNALYIHYLEMGEGPVKKHKGFIEVLTVGAMIQELIRYTKTGKTSQMFAKPTVQLKESSNGAMFYEKVVMRKFKLDTNYLTADDRRKMSRFRYGTLKRLEYEKQISSRVNRFQGGRLPGSERTYSIESNAFR